MTFPLTWLKTAPAVLACSRSDLSRFSVKACEQDSGESRYFSVYALCYESGGLSVWEPQRVAELCRYYYEAHYTILYDTIVTKCM